jgi:hypothetical protein
LIGRVLTEQSVAVAHIRHDGTLIRDGSLRDIGKCGTPQAELFETGCEEWKSVRSVSRRRAQVPSSKS